MQLRIFFAVALIAAAAACGAAEAIGAAPAARVTPELVDRQPALIAAAVSAIAKASAPGSQAWFVGFAGVGEERVFAEEIDLAARRMAERYGIGARSLRLVNDQRDVSKYPLASVGALRFALRALGRVMDDDDVLFLSLSSHGWKDATIAVSNAGMRPEALEARDLANMLDEAHIRWRVIVVSACYSGTFIKPLRDDHTILITAAAKNRPSFGCGADRDLTYFGEAFYRDALPRAPSLRAAFEAAKLDISAREKAERERPSNPQAWFGPAIEAKLAAMEPRDRALDAELKLR